MKITKFQITRSGFTLIEVLTVITIIAILGAAGFGTFMLVSKKSKVKQTEVMLENLSSHLEARVSQGFSQEESDTLGELLDANTSFPVGDGSTNSTKGIYAVLSGDYDLDGKVDTDRQSTFKEIDPQFAGKGQYLPRQSQEKLKQSRSTKLVIVDPWQTPLRYLFPGDKNNVENGFDLWSAGPDTEFGTEDDVHNW